MKDLTILGRRKQPSYKTSFDYFTNRSIDKELEDIQREHAALLKEYTNLTAIITAVTQYPDDPGLEAFIIEAGLEEIKLYDKLKQFVVRAEAFVKRIFGFIKQFGSARVSAAVSLIDEWIKVLEQYDTTENMNELKRKNNGKIPKVKGFISVYEKIIAFAEFNRDQNEGIFKSMEAAKQKGELSTDAVASPKYREMKDAYMAARDAVSAYISGNSEKIGDAILVIENPDVGGWFDVSDMKTLRDKVEATRSVMDLLVKQERLCLEFVKELGKNAEATKNEANKPEGQQENSTTNTPTAGTNSNNNVNNSDGQTIAEKRKALRDMWDDLSKNVLHGITDTIIKCSTKIGKIVTEFKSGFSTGIGQ